MVVLLAVIALLVTAFSSGWIVAKVGIGSAMDPSTLPERERQFAERMKGAALVGSFTMAGSEDRPPRADRYDISSVEKIGDDRWRFNARMRHDDFDVTLPVPVSLLLRRPLCRNLATRRQVRRAPLWPHRTRNEPRIAALWSLTFPAATWPLAILFVAREMFLWG
jgi:hypothetical protein